LGWEESAAEILGTEMRDEKEYPLR